MMNKSDMKVFIKSTVESIMIEINTNIELTIYIKVSETKLKEENKTFKPNLRRCGVILRQ